MRLKAKLKKSHAVRGLVEDARHLYYRMSGGSQSVAAYLKNHRVKKLQLGSGNTRMAGWLSTDIAPSRKGDRFTYLDVTKPFPMASNTFDFIYSEHVIEHISWSAGNTMLFECRRILKPGGVIRIATPNLATLVALYENPTDPVAQAYIRWITDRYLTRVGSYRPTFVINNAFRNWGHQFIYDKELLRDSLTAAGFMEIIDCTYGMSRHEAFQGIEAHGDNVDSKEMVEYETMIFEATK